MVCFPEILVDCTVGACAMKVAGACVPNLNSVVICADGSFVFSSSFGFATTFVSTALLVVLAESI